MPATLSFRSRRERVRVGLDGLIIGEPGAERPDDFRGPGEAVARDGFGDPGTAETLPPALKF